MTTVTLRPDPGVAALWSAWAGLLVAAGAWFVRDAPDSPIAWLTLLGFILVAAFFVVQLVAPALFEVRLTEDELQARTLWVRRRVSWAQVHVARVRTLFGDPVLELEVREAGDSLFTSGVLLPLGTDTAVLHRFLAVRLGTGELRAPDRLVPIDPS